MAITAVITIASSRGQVDVNTPVAADAFSINTHAFTARASGASGDEFNIGATNADSATNLAAAINASITSGITGVFTATASGNSVLLSTTGVVITFSSVAATYLTSYRSSPGSTFPVMVTITNSGGSSVNVTSVTPTIVPHGLTTQSVAVSNGQVLLSPSTTVAVAGSNGTLALGYSDTIYAPTGGGSDFSDATQQYDVGATIYTSDGSVTAATVKVITSYAPTY